VIKPVVAKEASPMSTDPYLRPDRDDVLQKLESYQQTGCQKTLAWLLNEHRDMCYSIAYRYDHRFEVDDTFQDCMEILIHAIRDHDLTGSYPFFSYAYTRVSREVARKKIRQWSIVCVPDNRELLRVFRKVNNMGIPAYPSDAKAKEIAEILDVKVEYVFAAAALYYKKPMSLDSGTHSDVVRSTLYDDSCSPERIVSEEDFEAKRTELAQRMMGRLNEREALVIQLRHLNEPPLKLREVGEELGITAARVQQIETKAMKMMMAA
jgi:RNA polymerase sigma-32 factor